MYIDTTYLIMYAGFSALAYYLYFVGKRDEDSTQVTLSYILAGIIVLTYFQFSGKYIIVSAIESGIGAFLAHLVLSRKK